MPLLPALADAMFSWAQSVPLPADVFDQIVRLTCGILC